MLTLGVATGGVLLATIGSAGFAVAASIGVPVFYALFTRMLDFLAKWELKGRRVSGEYMIWTEDANGSEWQLHTGGVDTLVALEDGDTRIASIERAVRPIDGNPCSLGLDLTAGAIAVDVASAVLGQGGAPYLGLAFLLHSVVLGGVITLVWMNHNARPYEFWWIKVSASLAVAAGALAMASSFLALDPQVVDQLLRALR